MPRYARNSTVLAKIESNYGTDSSPTGTANAILVSNININPLNAGNVDRALIRSYFGGSEQVLGTAYVECPFDVELAGAGTAGALPGYDPLLKACGFCVTTSSGTRVDYLPSTPGTDSVTIYYYDDGLVHKALGCRGTLQIKATVGVKPVFSFRFMNSIFEFLISYFAEDGETQVFLRAQLNEHVGRLMIDLPRYLGTGTLRRTIDAVNE